MKVVFIVVATMAATTGAFAPQFGRPTQISKTTTSQLFMDLADLECDDDGCIIPDEDEDDFAAVGDQGASAFRDCMVTDVNGEAVKLGDKMGDGKSVVVFLRHLG